MFRHHKSILEAHIDYTLRISNNSVCLISVYQKHSVPILCFLLFIRLYNIYLFMFFVLSKYNFQPVQVLCYQFRSKFILWYYRVFLFLLFSYPGLSLLICHVIMLNNLSSVLLNSTISSANLSCVSRFLSMLMPLVHQHKEWNVSSKA